MIFPPLYGGKPRRVDRCRGPQDRAAGMPNRETGFVLLGGCIHVSRGLELRGYLARIEKHPGSNLTQHPPEINGADRLAPSRSPHQRRGLRIVVCTLVCFGDFAFWLGASHATCGPPSGSVSPRSERRDVSQRKPHPASALKSKGGTHKHKNHRHTATQKGRGGKNTETREHVQRARRRVGSVSASLRRALEVRVACTRDVARSTGGLGGQTTTCFVRACTR